MQYAIEWYFDEETEEKLYELSVKIAEANISTKFMDWKTRPHLTLVCYNDVNEEKCIEKLKEFAKDHKAMPAYLGSVGMFPDTKTIFASPVMNQSMYQFQRELYEAMEGYDRKGWEWYCPDRWVPHCTIALTKEDSEDAFFQASNLVLHEFQKLSGKFASIGLVKVTFPVEEVFTVTLG